VSTRLFLGSLADAERLAKDTSRRQVKLQSWVVAMLDDLVSVRMFHPSIDASGRQQIFSTGDCRPLNSDYLGRQLKRILAEAGLPRIRLYDLRHTAASLALAAGALPKAISEQLGHANTAFTLDVYAHLLPHMQAEAAQRVESLLGSRPELKSRLYRFVPRRWLRSLLD
jgi:integrase